MKVDWCVLDGYVIGKQEMKCGYVNDRRVCSGSLRVMRGGRMATAA